MPVVTADIKRTLNDRNNAWFQVIDGINSVNIDKVKQVVEIADLVKYDKFSNALGEEAWSIEGTEELSKIIEELDNFSIKNRLNDTQKKNLLYKVKHWVKSDFKKLMDKVVNEDTKACLVVINDKVSKHEWLFLDILRKVGVNILVSTKDFSNISYIDNISVIRYNIDEDIDLRNPTNSSIKEETNIKSEVTEDNLLRVDKETFNIDDFITKFKESSKNIKLSIKGTDIHNDTLLLAAKLKDVCDKDVDSHFINEKIPKPSLDETSKIYRINRDNIDYIIKTLVNFVKCYNKDVETYVKKLLEVELLKLKAVGDRASIIYNKATIIICWINRYLSSNSTSLVFYGIPSINEDILLRILSKLDSVNLVIISADKQSDCFQFLDEDGINIEFSDSKENTNLEMISIDTATTLAYNASKVVDATLYGENTIGLYKEGQIIDCNTKHLACTFDEVAMWWNKEMFIRPGYKQFKNSVEIPVQFGVIRGVQDLNNYKAMVQRYCCGNTVIYHGNNFYSRHSSNTDMIIHHCTDINGTLFSEQKPFIVGDKLQTQIIKNSRNFKYSFLDANKQNFILSKIQEILDDKMLFIPQEYKNNKEAYYNKLLDITLNLDINVIRIVQWFNYTDYNPNVIVTSTNENTLTFEDVLYLRFLSKLGFDILIFVPTLYSSVEKFLNNTEYETYDIGRAEYHVDLTGLNVINNKDYVQNKAEKKGFFSRLFN